MISDYKTLLQELRHRYELKYGKVIDDEILYIIVRINELQVEMLKEINRKKVDQPVRKKDYFYYGIGKSAGIVLIGLILIAILLLFLNLK